VTHRIVEIDREQQLITTKGDNNNVQDGAPVSYRNVVGRVKFGVRGIGYFILILNTNFGKWMLAIVMVALIGIEIIRRMYYHDKFEEEAENARNDEQDAELMQ
jgi:signal peptidase I